MAELVHLLKSAPLKILPQRLLFFLYNLETNPREGQDILLRHVRHSNLGLRLILGLRACGESVTDSDASTHGV